MKHKVLITGIRGFVGTNLRQYLSNQGDYHIIGSSRKKKYIDFLKNDIHAITSYDEVINGNRNVNSYVHLSGKVIDTDLNGSEDEYLDVNFRQTKKLFDRFINDEQAKKFVFISTIHVLTDDPGEVLNESYTPKPFTPYGKSKFMAEQYIVENCPAHKKYYILRPPMIHGPGNKGNLNLLYGLVKRGIPYPVGRINNKRSFLSVGNLCFIIDELLKNDVEQGLYHVADDDPTYTHDLINLIALLTGKKARILNVHPLLLNSIAKAGNVFPLPINEHKLKKLTKDFVVSNTKIKKSIGKPLPVTSREGIEKTIYSFINSNNEPHC